jgi:protein-S-isoprenylcysteine O-methyltransferase
MKLSAQIGLVYFASEIALRFMRRSTATAKGADRGSLAVLWVAIAAAVMIGIVISNNVPTAAFVLSPTGRIIAVVVFAAGLALRWWSIIVLGKFFTVDVAIASDHRVISHGPYRFVRHPSYSGMMLAFLAFAVTLENWLSIVGVLVPITIALIYRVRVEEAALNKGLGAAYGTYSKKTKRLVPGIF